MLNNPVLVFSLFIPLCTLFSRSTPMRTTASWAWGPISTTASPTTLRSATQRPTQRPWQPWRRPQRAACPWQWAWRETEELEHREANKYSKGEGWARMDVRCTHSSSPPPLSFPAKEWGEGKCDITPLLFISKYHEGYIQMCHSLIRVLLSLKKKERRQDCTVPWAKRALYLYLLTAKQKNIPLCVPTREREKKM